MDNKETTSAAKSPTKQCYIAVSDLRFRYPGGAEIAFPDLCFGKGEHWLITGPSGSGKTTLLHLLGGLLQPPKGQVVIDGQNTATMTHRALDRFRGQKIGIVFQTAHFVQALTVAENLSLAAYLAKKQTDPGRIQTLLERLGLGDKGHKKPHQLSVGEQQRAAIARAMVNQPAVVLADEPTASLDDANTRVMLDLLRGECEAAGSTLVIVTHDQRLKDLIDKVVEL